MECLCALSLVCSWWSCFIGQTAVLGNYQIHVTLKVKVRNIHLMFSTGWEELYPSRPLPLLRSMKSWFPSSFLQNDAGAVEPSFVAVTTQRPKIFVKPNILWPDYKSSLFLKYYIDLILTNYPAWSTSTVGVFNVIWNLQQGMVNLNYI